VFEEKRERSPSLEEGIKRGQIISNEKVTTEVKQECKRTRLKHLNLVAT
jgi:hypothetical protein